MRKRPCHRRPGLLPEKIWIQRCWFRNRSGLDAVGFVAAAAAAPGASTVTNDQDAATGAAVKTDSATAAAAGWLRSS